ncbi:F0F1 ATP synthase subunit B [Tomitella biformata]|uniref:F0F1 ATP synthase subunit B n=1 Tax=Tomitella biformata TaxID=630403 RepID=UPI000467833A|nr:F0F1 ATP synthase subunit B [Tomitella biformata]
MPTSDLVFLAENNPIIPASYDIVWSAIVLLVIGFFFWKFVMPIYTRTMAERTEKIEGGILRAEEAQAKAQAAYEQYNAQLAEARVEASRIREDAQEQGKQIVNEMKVKAQDESDRIIAAGGNQLQAQRQQIVAELRSDLGRTAVDLSEKILGASLSDEVTRSSSIDRFLTELDSVDAGSASKAAK